MGTFDFYSITFLHCVALHITVSLLFFFSFLIINSERGIGPLNQSGQAIERPPTKLSPLDTRHPLPYLKELFELTNLNIHIEVC